MSYLDRCILEWEAIRPYTNIFTDVRVQNLGSPNISKITTPFPNTAHLDRKKGYWIIFVVTHMHINVHCSH